jgi:hypothetical protein
LDTSNTGAAQGQYPQPQPAQQYSAPPATAPEKKKSNAPIIFSAAFLMLVVVAVAAGVLLFNRTANAPAVPVERLLPANTLGFITVDTSLSGKQSEALDKMKAAFESQPGFKEAWAKMVDEVMSESEDSSGDDASEITDFDSLSQFLGNNLTVALLPPSTADLEKLGNADEMGEDAAMDVLGRNVVGLLDLDFNPLNKKGPIGELKRQADQFTKAELVEKHQDVEIRKYVSDTTTVFFALLPGTSTAAVGGQPDPLRVVIDQFKAKSGLETDAAFKRISGQVPQERIATVYLNLTEVYKQVKLAAPEELAGPLSAMGQEPSGSVLMTLSAQDGGLQVDAASEMASAMMGVQGASTAKLDPSIASDVPAGALAFLAGTDLKSTLQSALDSMRKQSEAGGEDMVTPILEELESSMGVDVESDVLPWMGGDYAVSVGVNEAAGMPAPSVVFQMKLNSEDRAKAAEWLAEFVASAVGDAAVEFEAAGGTFYTADAEMGLVLGVASDRLMLVVDADQDAARATLDSTVAGFGKGAGASAQWKDAASRLPKESNAFAYFDIKGMREMAERTLLQEDKEYEEGAAPFVRPFKYLSIGGTTSVEGEVYRSHGVLFLGIGQ